jgi:hypothetical protein
VGRTFEYGPYLWATSITEIVAVDGRMHTSDRTGRRAKEYNRIIEDFEAMIGLPQPRE